MIKLFQKVSVFYISRFEAAVKAMKDCGKQPWTQKVSKDQMQQLEKLYKEATSGVYNTMTQEKGTSPNFDSAMNSFRSPMGRETAQGATQGDILKQQLNQTFQKNPGSSQSSQNKADFIKAPKSPQDAGIKQTRATQSLAKGQTVKFEEPKPKINEDTMKSKAETVSQQGYGNRTGFQQIRGSQPPGSNPYKQKQRGLDKSKSKEQIENEYVNLAKSILQKHKAQKYIKDF